MNSRTIYNFGRMLAALGICLGTTGFDLKGVGMSNNRGWNSPTIYTKEICGNRIDDDHDGLTDYADRECFHLLQETEVRCSDGLDNDNDPWTDCDDPDCEFDSACKGGPIEICGNLIDDDGDCPGDTNEDGWECSLGDIGVDYHDTDCPEPADYESECSLGSMAACCNNGLDNNGDGLIDAADVTCLVCENGAPIPPEGCICAIDCPSCNDPNAEACNAAGGPDDGGPDGGCEDGCIVENKQLDLRVAKVAAKVFWEAKQKQFQALAPTYCEDQPKVANHVSMQALAKAFKISGIGSINTQSVRKPRLQMTFQQAKSRIRRLKKRGNTARAGKLTKVLDASKRRNKRKKRRAQQELGVELYQQICNGSSVAPYTQALNNKYEAMLAFEATFLDDPGSQALNALGGIEVEEDCDNGVDDDLDGLVDLLDPNCYESCQPGSDVDNDPDGAPDYGNTCDMQVWIPHFWGVLNQFDGIAIQTEEHVEDSQQMHSLSEENLIYAAPAALSACLIGLGPDLTAEFHTVLNECLHSNEVAGDGDIDEYWVSCIEEANQEVSVQVTEPRSCRPPRGIHQPTQGNE